MSFVSTQSLSEIPLFFTMDDEERQELCSLMTERTFQPGEVIVQAGEPGDTLHIIQEGDVDIWLIDADGRRVMLDVLGPGKFLGELSMLSGESRSASATPEPNEKVVTLALKRTDFFAFLKRRPDAILDVLAELAERMKHTDDLLRTRVSRNPNDAIDEHVSIGQRIADVIAEFSGSIPFLMINLFAFVFWIVLNTLGPKSAQFDPYPFQFLTMAVSLEAIFLSIFVLVSQNRQGAKDRIKADLDYQVDVKAEIEMTFMSSRIKDMERKLQHIHHDILNAQVDKSQAR